MKRKAAAFTIVQNEAERLSPWISHYNDLDGVYVLDHDSWEMPFDICRASVVPVHNTDSFSHSWMRNVVQDFQKFLFNSYECVIFSEVDEFVIYEKGLARLIEAMSSNKTPAVRCRGVEVVERDGKPSYELSHWYDKTLVTRCPVQWTDGFHECNYQMHEPLDSLWLVHTHRQNYAACRQRHKETAARKWSQKDIATGAGAHNRIQTDAEFDAWFYRHDGPAIELPEAVLKQLPKWHFFKGEKYAQRFGRCDHGC